MRRQINMGTRRSSVIALVAMLLATGAVTAGCTGTGDSSGQGRIGVTTPSPSEVGAQQSVSASADPSASGPVGVQSLGPGNSPGAPGDTGTSPTSGQVRVNGVVVAGVEPGCVLLKATDRSYLLLGGDRSKLLLGSTITVVGTVEPDLMSTCQQGTPLRVTEVS